jgi:uncharacterized protein YprB with RNaseH-like and TPR domain/predicted nuclease with RNAse H fold/dephospho-CoA kinase
MSVKSKMEVGTKRPASSNDRYRALLTATFCHLRGISADRERALWKSGVTSWDEFEKRHEPQLSLFSGGARRDSLLKELELSRRALEQRQLEYFAEKLPRREHYRLAYAFPEDTIFLDIETTGLSRHYDYITLVGISRGSSYLVHLKGCDPAPIIDAINLAKVIVTFNGSLFDLPFLSKELNELRIPKVHVDLRFLARRIGLKGGQKEIEEKLSLKRPREIADLRGESAPVLWHRFRRGDEEALKTLILYNHADIHGMKGIFDHVGSRLIRNLRIPLADLLHTKFAKTLAPLDPAWKLEQLRASFGGQFGSVRSATTITELGHTDTSRHFTVVGIDLTGSEQRPTGWCSLTGNHASTSLLSTDEDIVRRTLAVHPQVVSIDSPLSLPKGWRIKSSGALAGNGDIMRFCERVLKKRGVNAYPALIPSMQKLTARGIRLAQRFRSYGIPTIESYPGAAQDVMNIPRKRASLELLKAGLEEFGLTGDFLNNPVSHDELDAITSAAVGLFFWSGKFERLGPNLFGDEGLIIPDLNISPFDWKSRVVFGVSGSLAAGKTTAAQTLQAMGFHYGRYSMVIEDSLRQAGRELNRATLQEEGQRLHTKRGQRWLGEQLLKKLPPEGNYVIDGLRFPEDHAFLAESFGPAFVHVHISTSKSQRRQRYVERGGSGTEFDKAEAHDVESQVSRLETLAKLVLRNDGSFDEFINTVRQLVTASACRLQ